MSRNEVRTICVIGAGTMGPQIAWQCALSGKQVSLMDISEEALGEAKNKIDRYLEDTHANKESPSDSLKKTQESITYTTDIEEASRSVDFAIEAVYENLEVKRRIFSRLDQFCPSYAIIASNTSSIRPSKLADATKRVEKVLCMNFENPVWDYPMVEIMGSHATSKESLNTAIKLAEDIGLTPILVRKEVKGYVMNRIWRAIKKEALFLVDKGYAHFEDIDRAFMISQGTLAGPFMIMDRIGLDVVKDIEEQYYLESGDPSDKPPKILAEKVKQRELGVKTGKGFYKYPNPSYKASSWLKGGKSIQ